MRVLGDLVHSVAAGGIVTLTARPEGQGSHGVAAGATVTLTGPMASGDALRGIAGEGAVTLTGPSSEGFAGHGAAGTSIIRLVGPSAEGDVFVDLSTIYIQVGISLSSPGAKGRALTLPTHGQRTVLIAGEQRVVAPPNEPRSLNIGNELRVITVAPE